MVPHGFVYTPKELTKCLRLSVLCRGQAPGTSAFDWTGKVVSPLPPGSVIDAHIAVAQQFQSPESVRRTDAALSISEDILVRSDANISEHFA
jgi:hypothetical protein